MFSGGCLSDSIKLPHGVPQGSCLGPLLFTIYSSKLFEVIKDHLPVAHAYTDDTHLYLSFKPDTSSSQFEAIEAMELCIKAIRAWMTTDKFKLNDDKTEFSIIGTQQQLSKVHIERLSVGDVSVVPVTAARNLGTWFDTNLSLVTHITKTCKAAFYHLHNIRCIRKFLTMESTKVLVHAFIMGRIVVTVSSMVYRPLILISCNACKMQLLGRFVQLRALAMLLPCYFLYTGYQSNLELILRF